MSTNGNAINGLKERKIGLNDEEIYAVIIGYNRKLNNLSGVSFGRAELEKSLAMLKAAMQQFVNPSEMHKQALEQALSEYQPFCHETVQTILAKEKLGEETVLQLHSSAVKVGCNRAYRETRKSGNDFANIDEALNAETNVYVGEYEDLLTLYRIATVYTDQEIQDWLNKSNSEVPVAMMKALAEKLLPERETDFLNLQMKHVTRSIGYNVDQDCRMILASEAEA